MSNLAKGTRTLVAYLEDCNIPAVICNIKEEVVYINALAKELLSRKIDIPIPISEFEKICGFSEQRVKDSSSKIGSYACSFIIETQEGKIIFERYKYHVKGSNIHKKYIYYYKTEINEDIIPLTPRVFMEDICNAQELHNYNQAFSTQISIMTHNIRTAIGLTSLNMQLLSEMLEEAFKNIDPASKTKMLEMHQNVNDYITAAIEGCFMQNEYLKILTIMARGNRPENEVASEVFNIVEEIQRMINLFQTYARRYSVKLNWDGDTTPCYINSDKIKISEALSNLLQNAIKYTGCKQSTEKNVSVSIKSTKNHVEIIIKDTGIGIEEDDLKHLAEKYFRAHKAGELAPYGQGLGLYSAYNNIALLGGTVKCTSTFGEGSTFIIVLNRGEI